MVKLSMEKKPSHQSYQNIKIDDQRYKKNLSGARSVDINVLLNRVKIEKVKEQKKKYCIYYQCSFRHMFIWLPNF